MAYIKRCTTKAGTVSTALVEAYRDNQGRPRQRLLANLYGEPDTLRALAKLAAQREALRKEMGELTAPDNLPAANQFYEEVTARGLESFEHGSNERDEVERLLAARERLLRRIRQVEKALAAIARAGNVISANERACLRLPPCVINPALRKVNPAKGNGRVQKQAKRALISLQGLASTSDVIAWSGAPHWSVRRAVASLGALKVRRSPTGRGRPRIWRLYSETNQLSH